MSLYRVLQDKQLFASFHELAQMTPHSREQYHEFLDTWQDESDPVRKAWKWWVVARQSFAGRWGESWGNVVTTSSKGMAKTCASLLTTIDSLPAIHARLQRVQIENTDALTIIKRYAVEGCFIYCDPPYVPSTRKSSEYKHEMTEKEHEELIEALLSAPAKIMLSGYDNELYQRLDAANWDRREFQVQCNATGRTRAGNYQGKGVMLKRQPRTEVVWRNYTNTRSLF